MPTQKILVIDFDAPSIERATATLTRAGFEVEVARDGVAGLEAFERLKPDLVLVEAMLPRKHGFDVCQQIKQTAFGKCTPILVTSNESKDTKYVSEAMRLYGCDEYVQKPVADRQLIELCRKMLPDAVLPEPPRKRKPAANMRLDDLTEDELMERLDGLIDAVTIREEETSSAQGETGSAEGPQADASLEEADLVRFCERVFHGPGGTADEPEASDLPEPPPPPPLTEEEVMSQLDALIPDRRRGGARGAPARSSSLSSAAAGSSAGSPSRPTSPSDSPAARQEAGAGTPGASPVRTATAPPRAAEPALPPRPSASATPPSPPRAAGPTGPPRSAATATPPSSPRAAEPTGPPRSATAGPPPTPPRAPEPSEPSRAAASQPPPRAAEPVPAPQPARTSARKPAPAVPAAHTASSPTPGRPTPTAASPSTPSAQGVSHGATPAAGPVSEALGVAAAAVRAERGSGATSPAPPAEARARKEPAGSPEVPGSTPDDPVAEAPTDALGIETDGAERVERPASRLFWVTGIAATLLVAVGLLGFALWRQHQGSSARRPSTASARPVGPPRPSPEVRPPRRIDDRLPMPGEATPLRSLVGGEANSTPANAPGDLLAAEPPARPVAPAAGAATAERPAVRPTTPPQPSSREPESPAPQRAAAREEPAPAAARQAKPAAPSVAAARPSGAPPEVPRLPSPQLRPTEDATRLAVQDAPVPPPVVASPATRRGDLVPLADVDSEPVPLSQPAPEYDALARRMRQEGTVLLELLIDENGRVSEIRQGSGGTSNGRLIRAAESAVRRWRYAPATKDGVDVRVWQPVSIEFRL